MLAKRLKHVNENNLFCRSCYKGYLLPANIQDSRQEHNPSWQPGNKKSHQHIYLTISITQ